MARISVAEVMTRRVVYLPGDTMLDEAAQAMRDQGIGEGLPPRTTTIESIASRELIMVEQSATVEEAVQAMRERGVRRLLVCDADRKVVGIISLSDVALLPTSAPA
jgi:CBS domain-containing protein